MSQKYSTQCPHCRARLRLKNRNKSGQDVECPKCGEDFVVKISARPTSQAESPRLPPRKRKRDSSPIPRHKKVELDEEKTGGFAELFSKLIWINAHIAVAICIIDNAIDFVWLITHFNEVYQQAGIGRLAVRRVGRPLLIIIACGAVWFQSVLPRDISTRPVAFVFGGGILLLFGLLALVIGALVNSVYDRPVSAVQWSTIYLGFSLLAFGVWGFGPETPVQYAERLMVNGNFYDALAVVQKELEKDPDNIQAIKLEVSLKDILKSR